ncbi:hypothetical protein D3C86_1858710 [compost metagenome]
MADPPAAAEVDAHQRRLHAAVTLHGTGRRLAAQLAQGLAQLGGNAADDGQPQLVHILEVTIEGVGVQPGLPRQLAQAQAAQAAALGAQAQRGLHGQALAGGVGAALLRLLLVGAG